MRPDIFFSSLTVDFESRSVVTDLAKKFLWYPGYLLNLACLLLLTSGFCGPFGANVRQK